MKARAHYDREWRTGWAFAAPGLALLAVVMGFPLAYSVLMAISSLTLTEARSVTARRSGQLRHALFRQAVLARCCSRSAIPPSPSSASSCWAWPSPSCSSVR